MTTIRDNEQTQIVNLDFYNENKNFWRNNIFYEETISIPKTEKGFYDFFLSAVSLTWTFISIAKDVWWVVISMRQRIARLTKLFFPCRSTRRILKLDVDDAADVDRGGYYVRRRTDSFPGLMLFSSKRAPRFVSLSRLCSYSAAELRVSLGGGNDSFVKFFRCYTRLGRLLT